DPCEDHSLLDDKAAIPETMIAAEECHKRLLSVCNPYEVDRRAKDFSKAYQGSTGHCRIQY
ncbi:hypothetical protein EVA_13215, partial [gut metagenome]